ncbi:MAG: aldo/keto reductase [Candidatus Poribacteria bacterium]
MAYNIPRIKLGRTGIMVTRLGIGGAYCKSIEGYRSALDCGVNYIDTARIYNDGDDERVIGEAIQGRRDNLILATKTIQRDAAGARKDLETSLSLLKTDYIDVYQLHHLNTQPDREQALAHGGALEEVQKARDEGLVRFIGVTGHDWGQIQIAVATGLFDTVLCWYSCAMREPEKTILPEARIHDTGVVIMNATRNGRLLNETISPEQFYRYVLSHEDVHITIMGLRDLDMFCRVASALVERDDLTAQEKTELEAYGMQMRASGKLE